MRNIGKEDPLFESAGPGAGRDSPKYSLHPGLRTDSRLQGSRLSLVIRDEVKGPAKMFLRTMEDTDERLNPIAGRGVVVIVARMGAKLEAAVTPGPTAFRDFHPGAFLALAEDGAWSEVVGHTTVLGW